MLRQAAAGVPQKELAAAGAQTRQTLWRNLTKHEGSVRAVFRIRAAVEKSTGVTLPPPVVSIRDDVDHSWCVSGMLLRDLDPDTFAVVMSKVRAICDTVGALDGLDVLAREGFSRKRGDSNE